MTHYFEKTIVDAKDIYTDYLLNVFSPLIYFGLKSVYDRAILEEKKYIEGAKIDSTIKNPGVIVLFQYFLMELETMNSEMVDAETSRFRDSSGCADIFDDLIKAVIKSHIIVLTYNASGKTCKIIKEKLHEKVDAKSFVHKCYLECSRIFFDHPRLFYHDFPVNERKDNDRIIYQLIKVGIKNGIKRALPMKAILEEYLKNDYINESSDDKNDYIKIKDLLNRDTGMNDEGGVMKIINTSESSMNDNFNKIEQNVDDIETLIYGKHVEDDTLDFKNTTEKYNTDAFVTKPADNSNPLQNSNPIQNEEIINDKISPEVIKPITPQKNNSETFLPAVPNSQPPQSGGQNDKSAFQKELKKTPEANSDILRKVKSKRGKEKENILIDAITAVKNDDQISIVRNGVVNKVNDGDNFFDETMN